MTIKVEDNKIIFSRTIEAPIEKVFDANTTKELFEKWFHPKDASTKVFRFNAVSGGDAFYAIKTPTMTSYTLAEYKTVKRPYLIEYIDSFATPERCKRYKNAKHENYFVIFQEQYNENDSDINIGISNKKKPLNKS